MEIVLSAHWSDAQCIHGSQCTLKLYSMHAGSQCIFQIFPRWKS